MIRSKYGAIPIPNETSLDGDTLGQRTYRKRNSYYTT